MRRSMRRCLIAQSRSMSKTPRPPSCAYSSSGLIAFRPPYKNTLRSQKSVPLHSTLKKCYAARSIMYIRPMTNSQPIDDREKKHQKQHEKWKLLWFWKRNPQSSEWITHNLRNKSPTIFGINHPQLSEQNIHNLRKSANKICIIHLFFVPLQRFLISRLLWLINNVSQMLC